MDKVKVMAITINGSGSVNPSSSLSNNQNTAFNRISSGQRINSASDDAAGLAIANRMSSQENGYSVAIRNAGDGISLTQLANGALSSITDNLQRIRELSLQAANGTLNTEDRRGIQQEIDQMTDDTVRILEDTSFNGVKVFSSEASLNFQTGPNADDQIGLTSSNLQDTLNSAGINELSALSPSSATSALDVIDTAIKEINTSASQFGALANRFESNIENLSRSRENIAEAKSRISDADIAKEASALINNDIKNQVEIAVQSQANANQQNALRLLS